MVDHKNIPRKTVASSLAPIAAVMLCCSTGNEAR